MPPAPTRTVDVYKFGEDFELDLRSFELRSSGTPLKLRPLQMEFLILLIERRGELVTREQIAERLWGKGVFLDTDNSINGAISRIRQVLRDSSDSPRIVQTVPGRGYRFIASVVEVERTAPAPVELSDLPSSVAPPPPSPPSTRNHRWVALLLIPLIAGLGALGWWYRSRTHRTSSQRVMLAVLPFENLTGDPAEEYFVDGLTEEMITQLGQLGPRQIGVIARTSVMHYKGNRETLGQIERELQVDYVLEGSVRRDAKQVRITAQLIRTNDQTHVWARDYDRESKDLLTLQSEIAQQVASEIAARLSGPRPRPASPPAAPPDAEAYELFLKGRYAFNKRSGPSLQQAIGFFAKAIAMDPAYARAYAAQAQCYALLGGYTATPQEESIAQARAAAQHALEIDERLTEAHTALALVAQNYDHDWQTAGKEFRRALELDPNDATAHHWYAEHLAFRGRFDESFREIDQALKLDPLSLIVATDYGVILYQSRQFDRAIAQFRDVLEMEPDFHRAHLVEFAYVQKGRYADAIADLETWRRRTDNLWIDSFCTYVYGRSGDRDRAAQALKKLTQINAQRPTDPAPMAVAYIGTGDYDQALAWLEKAQAQHSNIVITLRSDPLFDPLRGNPRFQNLLHNVGLDQ